MKRLCEGRVAIVTGAGRGLGREHARMLAAHGARVLVNDCGSGVMRHADAGYELAIETAKKQGLHLPMLRG